MEISKETFVEAIEAIRTQLLSNDLSESLFRIRLSKSKDNVKYYDTIKLVRSTIRLLELFFPKDENGFSEIEHYIFYCNFGKENIDAEYEPPSRLYDRLIKNQSK